MKFRSFVVLSVVLLLSAFASAGLLSYTVTTNLQNEPPVCTATVTTDCVLGTRLYYDKGFQQIDVATNPFLATATGSITQSGSNVPVKSYAKGLVFKAVVQGKDVNGAIIESNPTSAAPVDLKPGAVVSLTVTIP